MRSGQGWGPRRIAAVVLVAGLTVALALAGCGGSGDDTASATPVPTQTALTTPTPAASASSSPEPGVDLEANQALLAEVADQVDETAKGYAQVVQNIAKLKMTIYWKGQPPPEVRDLEGRTGTGVQVVIVEAKLSKADVDAAIRRISQAAASGKLPTPDSILANRDFDGIVIGFEKSKFASYDNATTRAQFEDAAKVPVTIAPAGEHAPD